METDRKKINRKPFTIIELLVVIAVIIILAAMLIPVIKTISENASEKMTRAQMATIMEALEEYKTAYGYYPIPKDGPNTVMAMELDIFDGWMGGIEKYKSVDPSDAIWKGKYGASAVDESFMVDPYDETYYYLYPGKMNPKSYDLWSTGPDLSHGDYSEHGVADCWGTDPAKVAWAQNRDDNDDVTNWKSDFN